MKVNILDSEASPLMDRLVQGALNAANADRIDDIEVYTEGVGLLYLALAIHHPEYVMAIYSQLGPTIKNSMRYQADKCVEINPISMMVDDASYNQWKRGVDFSTPPILSSWLPPEA